MFSVNLQIHSMYVFSVYVNSISPYLAKAPNKSELFELNYFLLQILKGNHIKIWNMRKLLDPKPSGNKIFYFCSYWTQNQAAEIKSFISVACQKK